MSLEKLTLSFFIILVVVWLCRQVWGWVRHYRPRVNLGDAMSGSVYIFWDRSFSDWEKTIVKIGVSRRRDIRERVEEVRCDMGGDPVCVWKMDHVPFPFAVEFAAHQYMSSWRVRWVKGSKRGQEWFWCEGDKGMARAISAVERACRRVRKVAKSRKRWSTKADTYISIWKLSDGRVSRTYPFRSVSSQVERNVKQGGNGFKKTIKAQSVPPPIRPRSGPRAAAAPGGRYSRGQTRT